MSFRPNLQKVIFSLVIAFCISLATTLFILPLSVSEQIEQTEGFLKTAMIRFPKPIVFLYLLILLIIYYASIHIIWSLIEKSKSKSKNEGIKITKRKK